MRVADGPKLGLDFKVVDLFDAVLDKEGLGEVLQLKVGLAAVELLEHGFEDGVFFGVGAGLCGGGQADGHQSGSSEHCNRTNQIHCASKVLNKSIECMCKID
jgi:hypothetical protein